MSLFAGGLNTLKAVQDEGLAGQQTSLGQSVGASLVSGIREMPTIRLSNWLHHEGLGSEGDTLTPEDANARYGIKDVLNFDKPVSSALARSLNEEKQHDLLRQNTIRNGPKGIVSGVLNGAAGAIPSFLDPVNFAATMVPGLGEARISMGLGRLAAGFEEAGMTRVADGLLGAEGLNRAAGRVIESNPLAGIANSAGQGALGMAALEPLNAYLDRDEHNDWSMGQALGNIAFGGLMGGGLHALGHGIARWRQSREGLPDSPSPTAMQDRLQQVSPDTRGQVFAESIAAMAGDRPGNAETLLHINELEQTRRDLDRYMEEHGSPGEAMDAPGPSAGPGAPPLRDRLADDLASLQQKHADTLADAARHERPPEDPATTSTPARPAPQPAPEQAGPSLFTFLIRHGGILDEGGELKAGDMHRQRIGLVRKQGGLSLDKARGLAEEHGYLRAGSDINDLLHAMTEESHGRKVFADGRGPVPDDAHDPDLEEHYRNQAADDVDEAAHAGDIPLSPEEHTHATEAVMAGLHPESAIEEALHVSRYATWDRYADMLDHGRALQQERITARQGLIGALTRQRLEIYARHLDAGTDIIALHHLADSILESDNPAEAIEAALQAIEHERGEGHDADLQEDVQAVYQAARQRLGDLQEEAAENILRNLHGYEDHEITQSRAGLTARREGSPSPETGQEATPLPTSGIEHLDLSAVGEDPVILWRMPATLEKAPAWPVIIGNGAHYPRLDRKGKPTGRYGGHGRIHIMAGHAEDIKKSGFTNADDYVKYILNHATEIRQSNPRNGKGDGSYFVIYKGNENAPEGLHDTVVLHLMREDGYYRVATAGHFTEEHLAKRKLLLDGNYTPSSPNGRTTGPTDNMATKADNHARLYAIRHSSSPDNGNPPPRSQDKSISEAQAHAARIDQQLAVLGEQQIDPEALAGIQQEQAMSDGNADALASAATCLTRKAP